MISETDYQKFKTKKKFEKSTQNSSAKFFPEFRTNYEKVLENCIKGWVDKGANKSYPYVEFDDHVGADNGKLTKTVEIYFTSSGGAHIRPKYLEAS